MSRYLCCINFDSNITPALASRYAPKQPNNSSMVLSCKFAGGPRCMDINLGPLYTGATPLSLHAMPLWPAFEFRSWELKLKTVLAYLTHWRQEFTYIRRRSLRRFPAESAANTSRMAKQGIKLVHTITSVTTLPRQSLKEGKSLVSRLVRLEYQMLVVWA